MQVLLNLSYLKGNLFSYVHQENKYLVIFIFLLVVRLNVIIVVERQPSKGQRDMDVFVALDIAKKLTGWKKFTPAYHHKS